MATLKVTGNLQQASASQTLIVSDNALTYQVVLPVVDDGSGSTVDNGVQFVVAATGDGALEVLDSNGHRVWWVRPHTAIILKSTDEPAGSSAPRWVPERPAQAEAAKITDLAATNLATNVADSAVDFEATYVEAEMEAASDAAIAAVTDSAINLAHATYDEVKAKIHEIERALLVGYGAGLIITPNANIGTLALADSGMFVKQTVDNDENLVTSARSTAQTIRLPEVDDGTSGTVAAGWLIRLEANAAGQIFVEDFYGRRVGTVPAYSNAFVQASGNVAQPWQFFNNESYEIPLGNTSFFDYTPMVLSTETSPTITPASAYPAAYGDDATFNAATDVGIDAALDELDAAVDAINDEFEARINLLLVSLEAAALMATS